MADPIEQVNTNELLGQVIDGRYKVEAVLGAGGMGVVFRAVQTSVQRPVAMKTLHPQLAMAPTFFERFKREAETASRLHHPNIITVFDFGRTPEGLCYYVMEMLEGVSLRQRIRQEGPMTLRQAAAVIEQVALGVGHAHRNNVIHRDLKPHNVMLSLIDGNEYVKVLDFGLVKAMEQEDEEQLTSTGQVLGTPQYMPPEQAGGDRVDRRSDLYSLTGVFYFCLTGQSPFGANTVRKALQAALTQKPAPIGTHRKGAQVPEAIDQFCQKGLQAEQDARFQSTEEFIEALHAALAGVPDQVLDAVPQHTSEPLTDSGSGSSSASRRASSRHAIKSVSAISTRPKGGQTPQPLLRIEPHAGAQQSSRRRTALFIALGGVVVLVAGLLARGGLKTESAPSPPVAVDPSTAVTPPPEPAKGVLRVSLATTPPGAEVVEDGVTLGNTPLSLAWQAGARRTLTFKLSGHKDLEKTVKPESDEEFSFSLEPVKKPPSGSARPNVKTTSQRPPGDEIGTFE